MVKLMAAFNDYRFELSSKRGLPGNPYACVLQMISNGFMGGSWPNPICEWEQEKLIDGFGARPFWGWLYRSHGGQRLNTADNGSTRQAMGCQRFEMVAGEFLI